MDEGGSISAARRPGLLERIGNPLDWTNVDKCLLGTCTTTGFVAGTALLVRFLRGHPAEAPYLNQAALILFEQILYWMILGWAAIGAIGLFLRRRRPESRAFVLLTIYYYLLTFVVGAYFSGPFTSPYAAMVFLGAGFMAFLLFDTRDVTVAFLLALLLVGLTVAAERLGHIPYAPLLAEPPYVDGRVSGWWMLTMAVVALLLMAVFFPVSVYIIHRWRDREKKLAEAYVLLRTQKQELVRAESLAAVGSLVTGAAHELRNPLGSSGALLQEIRKGLASTEHLGAEARRETIEALDRALEGQRRAGTIAERLYSLSDSLSTSGGRRPVGAIIEALGARWDDLKIVTDGADLSAQINYKAALTALSNLIENAVAAGGPPPTLAVTLAGAGPPGPSAPAEPPRLEFTVSDTGCGMDRGQQAQAFQPFFTGRKSGAGHGVGLGLYIVHELVVRMGGQVELQSEPGKGTRVTVRVPVDAAAQNTG